MIGWEQIYKVMSSMAPLYLAIGLGYASVKRWRMFTADQCHAINRFSFYFILPFFTFNFTAGVNPYRMNFRFIAGDVIAKALASLGLALWAKFWRTGSFDWAITGFSLSSFNNALVVGVPLLQAMYGSVGKDLVVQSSVIQSLIWFPILLFMLQYRLSNANNSDPSHQEIEIVIAHKENQDTGDDVTSTNDNRNNGDDEVSTTANSSTSTMGSTMKKVALELAKNPNCYACALGFIWALLAKRWNFGMPSILEGSLLIMATAGSGLSMFTIGLFMALEKKVIACGVKLSIYGMLMRFVAGPLAVAIGSLALGLRSNILRIVIIQAALPQSGVSFVYAQVYGLHANVLSTAVIFGTIVSLPLLIGYYAILDVLPI